MKYYILITLILIASIACGATTITAPTVVPQRAVVPAAPLEPQPIIEPTPTASNCDPSYPDVCIPPPPPDLDCGQITQRSFKVLPPDPHNFDRDQNGVGCETE